VKKTTTYRPSTPALFFLKRRQNSKALFLVPFALRTIDWDALDFMLFSSHLYLILGSRKPYAMSVTMFDTIVMME